jgi:hypothetical protein
MSQSPSQAFSGLALSGGLHARKVISGNPSAGVEALSFVGLEVGAPVGAFVSQQSINSPFCLGQQNPGKPCCRHLSLERHRLSMGSNVGPGVFGDVVGDSIGGGVDVFVGASVGAGVTALGAAEPSVGAAVS